jgi:hypothetical protein
MQHAIEALSHALQARILYIIAFEGGTHVVEKDANAYIESFDRPS